MSYTAEFWKLRKSGRHKGQYIYYKNMSVDHISDLIVGSYFKMVSKKGNLHKYYIDRKEHIYYDTKKEYYVQYFIREIRQ